MKRIAIPAGFALAGIADVQQTGFTCGSLQTQDLGIPCKLVVDARAEVDPGLPAGRHTHPGEEIGYALEGELELRNDGQSPKIFRADETFFVPLGIVHDCLNNGAGKAKVLATYAVEKGKPIAMSAP